MPFEEQLQPKTISTIALADLLELTARQLHSRGYAEDLFPAQWMALRYFAKAPADMCTASELARFQHMAPGPVSRTVRTLLQKGLLQKAADQPRGRAERLEVSPSGHDALTRDPSLELQSALSELDYAEQIALARGLELILRHLGKGQA
jgi:DNA-binding MarR family transcriptional regulator